MKILEIRITNGIPSSLSDLYVNLFVETFSNEPMFKYMFSDDLKRKEQVSWSVKVLFKLMKHKYTNISTFEELNGYALWFSPETDPTANIWKQLRAGYGKSPFKFGLNTFNRMLKCSAHEQKILNELNNEPHWILDVITTSPKYQRQGIGGKLMEPIFKIANKNKIPCLVITHNLRNVNFYEKYGFKLVLQESIVDGGPIAYGLRKMPF